MYNYDIALNIVANRLTRVLKGRVVASNNDSIMVENLLPEGSILSQVKAQRYYMHKSKKLYIYCRVM